MNKKAPLEVNNFPLESIESGSVFTFTPEIAKKVTHFTHGLHTYPAKFIPQIPRWAFQYGKLEKGDVVLDPFVGCGTTMVEARLMGYNSYGLEINPLAKLLSKVKTTPILSLNDPILNRLLSSFKKQVKADNNLIDLEKELDLPPNWRFWYPEGVIEHLIKIKRNILSFRPSKSNLNPKELEDFRDFLFICFSACLKKVSFFDERQIKVRFHKDKFKDGTPDPLELFLDTAKKHSKGIIEFSRLSMTYPDLFAEIIPLDAKEIDLDDNTVDLIVTSPPYLNAIDYPMAHKYNLFLLGLVKHQEYSQHCRDYIGVTERAVSKDLYSQKHLLNYPEIDSTIDALYAFKNPTDKIRAYIIWQYFSNMIKSLQECYRVLKPGKYCIIVVGDNTIRKKYIPTHEYIKNFAASEKVGFEVINWFFHRLRNTRIKFNRHKTGGKIKDEMVIILQKPGQSVTKIVNFANIKKEDWQFNGANQNVQHLTHDFHPYFAKFHPLLPRKLIKHLAPNAETIFDPFCGCGTVLVEAEVLGNNSIGVDANPLSCLISRVKTTRIKQTFLNEIQKKLPESIEKKYDKLQNDIFFKEEISTISPSIHNKNLWFQENVLNELGIIKQAINDFFTNKNWPAENIASAKDLCLLAFSRIILPVSNQQGESKYRSINKNIKDKETINRFLSHLDYMIEKILILNKIKPNTKAEVYHADSRNLSFLNDSICDFLVTSPPYLSSWDYGLYHKFRFIWLGLNVKKFNSVEIGRHLRREGNEIQRYTQDMHNCLREFSRILRKNSFCCIVNAPSLVNKQYIDTNKIIVEEARKNSLVLVDKIKRRTLGPHYGLQASLDSKDIKVERRAKSREKEETILVFRNKK